MTELKADAASRAAAEHLQKTSMDGLRCAVKSLGPLRQERESRQNQDRERAQMAAEERAQVAATAAAEAAAKAKWVAELALRRIEANANRHALEEEWRVYWAKRQAGVTEA